MGILAPIQNTIGKKLKGKRLRDHILKSQLIMCLSEVDRAHSPATFAARSHPVNPTIEVDSLGRIGLPLPTRDAEDIANLIHQAPFGKGSQTLVDLEVRKNMGGY